jgi:hypothetical protein
MTTRTVPHPAEVSGRTTTTTLRFSISAALVHRLGPELIKDPLTAFFELVKNSYDEDATEVYIRFQRSTAPDGKIVIHDNGNGMTHNDIKDSYLRVAGEKKVREEFSPRFRRRRLGAKGIGRFSAHKLGGRLKVTTRPEGSPEQFVFSNDAEDFTDDKDLDQVEVHVSAGTPKTGFQQGMIVEISALRDRWGRREIKKIRGQLSHLISPDRKDDQFSIRLDCPEFPELSGPLQSPIAGRESHVIRFSIDGNGAYGREVQVADQESQKSRERRTPLPCGPVEGVIRYYREGLKARERRLAADNGDESHMGIKVYRDGCRVRPYGEESDDWLQIKARRSSGGGKFYVKPQSVAGSVHITATGNPELRDATDREGGMDETEAFKECREFVGEHVRHLNTALEQETRSEALKRKRQTVKKILDTVINCLNEKDSPVYRDYVDRIDRSKQGTGGVTTRDPRVTVHDLAEPTKEEWRCRDCDTRWRVPKGSTPTVCGQHAVNRKGQPRYVEGCGSENIKRSKHERSGGLQQLGSVVSGNYALIGGRQISLRTDPEMGSNEEEYIVDEREIVINENHPAYVVAQLLDRRSGAKYEMGDEAFVPAIFVHIAKCASLAWGELHYTETRSWEQFKAHYDDLQDTICSAVQRELGHLGGTK